MKGYILSLKAHFHTIFPILGLFNCSLRCIIVFFQAEQIHREGAEKEGGKK